MNSDSVQMRYSLCARKFGVKWYFKSHLTRVYHEHDHNGSINSQAQFAPLKTATPTTEEKFVYKGLLRKKNLNTKTKSAILNVPSVSTSVYNKFSTFTANTTINLFQSKTTNCVYAGYILILPLTVRFYVTMLVKITRPANNLQRATRT